MSTDPILDESPWPEDVWPMTDKEYMKAIPDEKLRCAISGFLMREGWRLCKKYMRDMLDD